jgi:threonine aldolase
MVTEMTRLVDLRSDTVTKPTPAMRTAMAEAEVGDDGFGEDPTVRALEEHYAELVGKQAALFVPSGVMANQIALRIHTKPGNVVIAAKRAHVVLYEMGAAAKNAGVQFATLDDPDGFITSQQVAGVLEGVEHHLPQVNLLCLENTSMAGGGVVWSTERFGAVVTAAQGLPVHLDGARLFNAHIASGTALADLARPSSTVMSCLSKGLGAPVGSLLAGTKEHIGLAADERKRFGGTMRQAGIIAAGGLYALKHHLERLHDDHDRAKRLAEALCDAWPQADVDVSRTETNIVLANVENDAEVLEFLAKAGVLATTIAPRVIRFVTHLDVSDDDIDQAITAIRTAPVAP